MSVSSEKVCSPIDDGNRVGSVILDVAFAYSYALYHNMTYIGPVGYPSQIGKEFDMVWQLVHPPFRVHKMHSNTCRILKRKQYRNESILGATWNTTAWRKSVQFDATNTCVVHVRRGDVYDGMTQCGDYYRYSSDAYFMWAIRTYCKGLPVVIHSEHTKNVKWDWTANYTLRLNAPMSRVWRDIMSARVFIMSRSAFSMTPALFANGRVIYQPFWHKPLSVWKTTEMVPFLASKYKFDVSQTPCEGGQHGSFVKTVAACVLSPRTTIMFNHMPHAAQTMLNCLSLFRRAQDCVYYYPDKVKPTSFSRWFAKTLGCQTVTRQPRCAYIGHLRKRLNVEPGESFSWLDSNPNVVLPETTIKNTIGVVQRRRDRVIVGIPQTITPTFFERISYDEQAMFMREHSMIVMAHGAACTMTVFIRPCTVVIMLYPLYYYPIDFYENLVREVGGIPISWWSGAYIGEDIDKLRKNRSEAIELFKTHHDDRGTLRRRNINIHSAEWNALVTLGNELYRECRYMRISN